MTIISVQPPTDLQPVPTKVPRPSFWRTPLRKLTLRRFVMGGRLADAGRLPRYAVVFFLGAAAIWAPISLYLKTAPLRFTSTMSLILPGAGVSASVNLDQIGQASSYANSPFASSSISPTETYKRLLGADRILADAAGRLGIERQALGSPRVILVDQTGFIHIQMTGGSPEEAQARLRAVSEAFFDELDRLRLDEVSTREGGAEDAIEEYRQSVLETRAEITRLQVETGLLSITQYDEQVAANERLRVEVEAVAAELREKELAVKTLSSRLGLTPAQAAAALKLYADPEYLEIVRQMSDDAAQLAELRARFGPSHPQVQRVRATYERRQIEGQERARLLTGLPDEVLARIDVAPDGARADLLAELVRAEADRDALAARFLEMLDRVAQEGARLAEMAPLVARLEDLERNFRVSEAVFASAIARSESGKTDLYGSYPLVQVLEDPSLPTEPSSPQKKLALAAGVAATMLMIFGLSLGWIRGAVIGWLVGRRPAA